MTAKNELSRTVTVIFLTVSVVPFVLYIFAFASPKWISKEYSLIVAESSLPEYYNSTSSPGKNPVNINMTTSIGLIQDCRETTSPIKTSEKCRFSNRDTWQKVAFGFGLVVLVLGVMSVGLSFLIVWKKDSFTPGLWFGTVFFYFLTTMGVAILIVLFLLNKQHVSAHPEITSVSVNHDMDLGLYVAMASDALFFLVTLMYLGLFKKLVDPERVDKSTPPFVSPKRFKSYRF